MFKKIDKEQVNAWVKRAYENAKKHGWHEEEKSDKHWLMMIGTEITEAVQADRKDMYVDALTMSGLECVLANDHHSGLVEKFYEHNIEGTVESEFADICIRVFDFMGMKGYSVNSDIVTEHYSLQRFKYSSFTEKCFIISSALFSNAMLSESSQLRVFFSILAYMFSFSESLDINLTQQIELKMRYNESREYHHGGKKY